MLVRAMNDDQSSQPAGPPTGEPGAAAPSFEPPIAGGQGEVAPPMSQSGLSDGVERRLDPRVIDLHRLVGWIGTASTALLLTTGLVPTLLLAPPVVSAGVTALAVAIVAAMAWLTRRWPVLAHRHASYIVDAGGLEIRRGVIWRAVINVPRSRVQHTDVSQGPLERRFGLGTLSTFTAGTDYAQVRLHGLDRDTALQIRDHLLMKHQSDAV